MLRWGEGEGKPYVISAPTVLLSQPKNFHNETKRLFNKLQVFFLQIFLSTATSPPCACVRGERNHQCLK
jgi:hypothetical protein